MNNIDNELRNLMDLYCNRYNELEKGRKEAKDQENLEDEMTIEVLQRQCRIMIAELFKTMKNIGVLDDEEIEIGGIKKR